MDEAAIEKFQEELDSILRKDKKITGARMNIWTLVYLFGEVLDETDDCSSLKRGQDGWPRGATAVLGDPYGDDAFIFMDNNLEDGEVVIDFVEK